MAMVGQQTASLCALYAGCASTSELSAFSKSSADTDLRITPAPSPFRTEVAGDRAMELEQQVWSHGLGGEGSGSDGAFDAQDTLGQQRGQLAVAQEPAGCLDIAGSAAWR